MLDKVEWLLRFDTPHQLSLLLHVALEEVFLVV